HKNTHDLEKRNTQLQSLNECCANMYKKSEEGAESESCQIHQVVARWLKNRPN
ncbi:hypothetical protein BDV93DRAFT_460914, partial [Ceratobasidium sp. AG-I]